MIVYFAKYISGEVYTKLIPVSSLTEPLDEFFKERSYSQDLEVLAISVFCMSPKFESNHPFKKPKYEAVGKKLDYVNMKEDKAVSYQLRLDFQKYLKAEDIRPVFAEDVLTSLDFIKSLKQFKEFDITEMKTDFEAFFRLVGWINNKTAIEMIAAMHLNQTNNVMSAELTLLHNLFRRWKNDGIDTTTSLKWKFTFYHASDEALFELYKELKHQNFVLHMFEQLDDNEFRLILSKTEVLDPEALHEIIIFLEEIAHRYDVVYEEWDMEEL